MHILRRIALFLLILPLLEVVVFVLVAASIGFWNAVLAAVATSVAGALLLRTAGQPRLRQFQSSLAGGVAFSADGAGLFTVLAGFLLLLPGFLTDLLAILLLVPAVRRLFGAAITRYMRSQGAAPTPGVVDLEPGEWRDEPRRSLPREPTPRPGRSPDDDDKDSPWRKP